MKALAKEIGKLFLWAVGITLTQCLPDMWPSVNASNFVEMVGINFTILLTIGVFYYGGAFILGILLGLREAIK